MEIAALPTVTRDVIGGCVQFQVFTPQTDTILDGEHFAWCQRYHFAFLKTVVVGIGVYAVATGDATCKGHTADSAVAVVAFKPVVCRDAVCKGTVMTAHRFIIATAQLKSVAIALAARAVFQITVFIGYAIFVIGIHITVLSTEIAVVAIIGIHPCAATDEMIV